MLKATSKDRNEGIDIKQINSQKNKYKNQMQLDN